VLEPGYLCGDGVLNTTCGEQCDDGNTSDADGCQGDCQLPVCGDGIVDAGETCDDTNQVSCDGCSASCALEPGPVCGDGIVNPGCEECDDGNTAGGDGCQFDCKPTPANLLYDQTDFASGDGAPDQRFESVYSAYDSQGADDFVVTAPLWKIEGIEAPGSGNGSSIHVNVAFYPSAGGQPGGAPACEFLGITDYTDDEGDLSITLPAPCVLAAGHWWMALQVRQNAFSLGPAGGAALRVTHTEGGPESGQHFWGNRTRQTGDPGVWRNPGNAFGTGCTDWTPQTVCGVGGGRSPDFLFVLLSGPERVPALGLGGTLGLVVVLAAAAGHLIVRRR
jgi:cysteine-rich repeat protein